MRRERPNISRIATALLSVISLWVSTSVRGQDRRASEIVQAAKSAIHAYHENGMKGLLESSMRCYKEKKHTGFFCVEFDVTSSLIDRSFSYSEGISTIEYFNAELVLQRARPVFGEANYTMDQANKYLLHVEEAAKKEIDTDQAKGH